MMSKFPGNAEPQLGLKKEKNQRAGEWFSRGYLPHRNKTAILQSVTFRLADSLPQEKLRQLREGKEAFKKMAELGLGVPGVPADVDYRKKIEEWLDSGMGCCALRNPGMAAVMQETLLKFDGTKYRLLAWCIMPNHVHVLIEPLIDLSKIVQSWKSFTGRWALAHNAELGLGVPGKSLWMREYWDRFIRNEQHLMNVIEYIHNNPVKAGFCNVVGQWRWSSAPKQ